MRPLRCWLGHRWRVAFWTWHSSESPVYHWFFVCRRCGTEQGDTPPEVKEGLP